jgi:lipopolysaccharide/colanic/teichoic acid biosynthesis glycosyltransferase
MPNTKPSVIFVVTSNMSAKLFDGQLQHLSQNGFQPVLVTGEAIANRSDLDASVEYATVRMVREISPGRDLLSLFHLWREFRRRRPAITNVSTPKAGMVAGVAAILARVPCRIYTLRGLRFETARGLKRMVLLACEFLACRSAHKVIAVSESVRQKAIKQGLVDPRNITVVGKGSSNGVDVTKFAPARMDPRAATTLRKSLDIPSGALVLGFVGRLTCDKGVSELVAAYDELRTDFPHLYLLLLGNWEEGDPIPAAVRSRIEGDSGIVRPGLVSDAASFYALMDVLALPTHREGFPNVVLEAQAAALPVVTTFATGAVDSIVDGKTGLLVPVADAAALARAVRTFLCASELRSTMGQAGRARVVQYFRNDTVWKGYIKLYQTMLQQRRAADTRHPRRVYSLAKRCLDILAATSGLLLLSPVMLVVALFIRCTMGKSVLFRQTRPGCRTRLFTLLKFRTMSTTTDAFGHLLPDSQRLTRVGSLMRRLSLDELPQLWNVLRGDMSLVGPRPLLVQYLPRYTPEQARRHEVMPGITGWAQINGRNALSWEEKFSLDTWYVEHRGLALDVEILAMTVWRVLRRYGISNGEHATMPEFMGFGVCSARQPK